MTGTSVPNRSRTAVADRPRRRVRVPRQERHDASRSSGPTFDASTPPFAQTKPCGVSVIRTPCSIRTTRRASRRTTSIWRGSRSHSLGEGDRLGPRLDRRQVDDRALGLRHDLLGDDEDVVGAEREDARRPLDRVADQTGRGRRPPRPPGCRRGRSPRRGRPGRLDPAPAGARQRTSAVRRLASARSRSSGVSRSRASGPPSSTSAAPASTAAPRVGGVAVAAEAGVDRVRRGEEQGVRAAAVAVGDDRDQRPPRLAVERREHRVDRRRSRPRAGRSGGSGPPPRRPASASARPASTPRFRPPSRWRSGRAPSVSASRPDLVVRRHDERLVDPGRWRPRPRSWSGPGGASAPGAPRRRGPRRAATSRPRASRPG